MDGDGDRLHFIGTATTVVTLGSFTLLTLLKEVSDVVRRAAESGTPAVLRCPRRGEVVSLEPPTS